MPRPPRYLLTGITAEEAVVLFRCLSRKPIATFPEPELLLAAGELYQKLHRIVVMLPDWPMEAAPQSFLRELEP